MASSFFSGIYSLFTSKNTTPGANGPRKLNGQNNTSSGANGVGAGKINEVGKATGQGKPNGPTPPIGQFGGYKRRTKRNKKRKNRTRK